LEDMFSNAASFVTSASFAALIVVPLFVLILNFFGLGLTNREEGPHWHVELLNEMYFGFELRPKEYNPAVKDGLLHMRCYWSGEVIYDYAFHLANKHMFLSCFLCHPANPCAKWERIVVCFLVSLLIVFPVAAWSLNHPSGPMRFLLILFLVTYPRNVLRLYLMHLNVQQEMLEYQGFLQEGPAAKQALSREAAVFGGALVVIALVCVGCVLYIGNASDQAVTTVLWAGVPALGYAALLEPLADLLIPCVSKSEQGGEEETWVFGFFGRWRLERAAYPHSPLLYYMGEEIFLGGELREERMLIKRPSFEHRRPEDDEEL